MTPPQDEEASARRRRTVVVPLIIGCAILMQTLDTTMVATALPSMARELSVSPLALNLVLTAYLLGAAVFMPISGWAADRFGARTVFLTAIAVFGLSSLACGLSQNLSQVIGARLVQGCAGAMLIPVGRLVMLRTATKAEIVSATTVLTVPALLGPVIGPPLSGFIVGAASWRWVFLANAPVAIAGLALVARHIENVREPDAPRLDLPGAVLAALATAGLAIGLGNLGRGQPSTGAALSLAVAGLALGSVYVFYARRRPRPVVDLSPLRDGTYRKVLLGGFFVRPILGAVPYLLALLLQVALGLSALSAGLLTFATALGSLSMRLIARPLMRWAGFRRLLVVDGLLVTGSLLACAMIGHGTPRVTIFLILAIHGIVRAIQLTSLNALAHADLPPHHMSSGSTLMGVCQQLAQCLGIGLCSSIVHWSQQIRGDAALSSRDIAAGFIGVALISLLAQPFFLGLSKDAGVELIGGRP